MSERSAIEPEAARAVDFGEPVRIWRLRGRSLRLPVRTLRVRAALTALILLLAATGLLLGGSAIPLDELGSALLGQGRPATERLLWQWRLPRVLFALLAGVALAVAGSLFQSLTRNPLGSPDVIGFDAGAFTGALAVVLVLDSPSYALLAVGSLLGGLGAAAAVYLLSWRRGVQGLRLVVVGIGVATFLGGINSYLLVRSGAKRAQEASAWHFGSFDSLGFAHFWPFAACTAVLLLLAVPWAAGFGQLELGDQTARALGVGVERTRLVMTLTAVCLTAAVTASSGPIAFVALVAPHLARSLSRRPGPDAPTAGLAGAALLLTADLLGQRLGVSVGLITFVLGGGYFLWLLFKEGRR